MKLIIAGGRNYKFTQEDIVFLDEFLEEGISEVVSGGASGADSQGELWASSRSIPVKRFPADWSKHGRAAGPIRNCQMADYADAVVLFSGGAGTENMRKTARLKGLIIFER